MSATNVHRLDGMEPDNLLAFLALLGLLRALNQSNAELRPRISWTLDELPLRPRLHLSQTLTVEELTNKIATGIGVLAQSHDFNGCKDLNYSAGDCRVLLCDTAQQSSAEAGDKAALLSALMSDAALKEGKEQVVDPTPLCLLFGQGHQHFLERLEQVPRLQTPPKRGRGKKAVKISEQDCITEALFHPWHRTDPTQSFRWDPNEDVRYAMMAGDPTDPAYKSGTQHGANRLAAIGLAVLTLVPEFRARRVRPSIVGGKHGADGFSFAWPIWKEPATLPAIVAMLSHPELHSVDALKCLGVEIVMVAQRISVGKFMNFTRARPLDDLKS
ncbi:MAG: hypothetical protein RBR73_01275 [Halothiobacillaceae bacterium]|jgi:hypothetical protein|nr:hypothetical protein [Halothiobacillaceae bacterium]